MVTIYIIDLGVAMPLLDTAVKHWFCNTSQNLTISSKKSDLPYI